MFRIEYACFCCVDLGPVSPIEATVGTCVGSQNHGRVPPTDVLAGYGLPDTYHTRYEYGLP